MNIFSELKSVILKEKPKLWNTLPFGHLTRSLIYKRIILFQLGLIIVGFFNCCTNINKENKNYNSDDTITTSLPSSSITELKIDSSKIIKISAPELYLAFEKNEVSANANYTNNLLEITGDISKIEESENYCGVIKLDGYFSSTVDCYINDKDKVAKLESGQRVTLVGLCLGKNSVKSGNYEHHRNSWFADIIIDDCKLKGK